VQEARKTSTGVVALRFRKLANAGAGRRGLRTNGWERFVLGSERFVLTSVRGARVLELGQDRQPWYGERPRRRRKAIPDHSVDRVVDGASTLGFRVDNALTVSSQFCGTRSLV
jgi:hypothetical protein